MSAPSEPLISNNARVTSSTIRFYWKTPLSEGDSPISSYTLSCSSIPFSESFPSNINNYAVSSLTNGTSYTFQVLATNQNGNDSPLATYKTYQPGDRPSEPRGVSYTNLTTASAYVSWSTPTTDGGTPLEYYGVWMYPSDQSSNILSNVTSNYITKKYLFPDTLSTTINLPSSQSNYMFIVRSINDAGWSPDKPSNYIYLNNGIYDKGASLLFDKNVNSRIEYSNSADFRFGTSDFTVEFFYYFGNPPGNAWLLYQGNGSYGTPTMGFELYNNDGGLPNGGYFNWKNGAATLFGSFYAEVKGWRHWAITRSGTTLRLFKDGTLLSNVTDTYNYNDTSNVLWVGYASTNAGVMPWDGNIASFHIAKGLCKYTSSFTLPTDGIFPTPSTVLLLQALTAGTAFKDSSSYDRIPSLSTGVVWSSSNPWP